MRDTDTSPKRQGCTFPGDPYFRGKECEFIDGLSSYDPVTGEGKWGYTGTVTQVEPGAFGGETALQSLTLPEGIEYIGSNAFNNSGLEDRSSSAGSRRFTTCPPTGRRRSAAA